MASENTSGLSTGTTRHDDDSESENEVFLNPRTYDRQPEGTERSENVAAMTAGVRSSPIAPETDRMAATYLLQLRERDTQNQTDQAPVVSNSSRYQQVVPPNHSNTNPSQYRHTSMSNSLDPQGMIYSETNMKNTVAGLSNVIALMQQQQVGLQQQQVGLQQQQASMEMKQDSISSTLTNVLSLLQDLSNKAQNSSQNNCTDSIQNGSQRSADLHRTEQNPLVEGRAGGDHMTGRIAQDMARGSGATTVNTVLPEDHQSTASQQCREFNWENRDGQVPGTRYDDRSSSYHEDNSLNRNQVDQQRPYSVHWGEPGYNPTERYTESMPRSRAQDSRDFNEVKLPPFNGKEDWKVWVSRFETVAERRGWSDDKKLDNLIPKLQGKAGEFVFTQLPHGTLSCYNELIKELNSRFRVVETKRTFAAQFSQRTQRQGETAEEFAAELKRLYAKAYSFRGEATRQEDLVRRFLDGLRDSDARFEVEYNKEPVNIDEAVFHVVNFVQTRRRGSAEEYSDRKFKKYTRRTNVETDGSSDEEVQEEDNDRVYRLPAKKDTVQNFKADRDQKKKESDKPTDNASMKVLNETKDLMQDLVKQIQELTKTTSGNTDTQQQQRPYRGRNVVCYGCGTLGHIVRDCPQKANNGRNRNPNVPRGAQGGTGQRTGDNRTLQQPLN